MTAKKAKQPTIKFTLRPGLVTPHMSACYKKWWAARITEVKQSELAK